MPVLDLKVWTETRSKEEKPYSLIQHTHYIKPMSNKQVLHKEGAINIKTKMQILSNDLFRVMRNISLNLTTSERVTHIQDFMDRIQNSGYSKYDRYEVYSRAKRRFDKLVKEDLERNVPMFRPKKWKQDERAKAKVNKKYSWFKNKDTEAILFVESTPNTALQRQVKKIIKEAELKVKVIERSGTKLKESLSKSNPFSKETCFDISCEQCKIKKGICKKREVVYCIECKQCKGKFKYIGETARSLGERFREHFMYRNNQQSVFYNHKLEVHNGNNFDFQINILNTHPGDPMRRQVAEAVCIEEINPKLNRKEEWTTGRLLKRPQPTINFLLFPFSLSLYHSVYIVSLQLCIDFSVHL